MGKTRPFVEKHGKMINIVSILIDLKNCGGKKSIHTGSRTLEAHRICTRNKQVSRLKLEIIYLDKIQSCAYKVNCCQVLHLASRRIRNTRKKKFPRNKSFLAETKTYVHS